MLCPDVAEGTQHLAAQIRDSFGEFVEEPAEIGAVAVGELFLIAALSGVGQGAFIAAADNQRLGCECERPDNPDLLSGSGCDVRPHRGESLPAAETHQKRDGDIVEVLTDREFPSLLSSGEAVEFPAPESGTENTGRRLELLLFEQGGDVEPDNTVFPFPFPAILRDGGRIEFREAGVERRSNDLKTDRRPASQRMQHMQQQKTVFAARESDENPVALPDHAVAGDGLSGEAAEFPESGSAVGIIFHRGSPVADFEPRA